MLLLIIVKVATKMNNASIFLTLLNAQQEAFIACTSISSMLSDNLKETDSDPVILPVYAATGQWVNTYWLSGNKVGRNGYKGAYEALKQLSKYAGNVDCLVYVAQRDSGTSKYSFFNEIIRFLSRDLISLSARYCNDVEIASSILQTGNRLKSQHEALLLLIDKTIKVMRGKDEEDKAERKPKSNIVGQQQVLVEDIVNDQLAMLSKYIEKDIIKSIRSIVMKSDNKLQALRREIDKVELPF